MESNSAIAKQHTISEHLLDIASFENVKRVTNVKAVIISTVMLAAGAYMTTLMQPDYPGSNFDIFRMFMGWALIIAAIGGIGFYSKRWIYQPTSSAISRNSVTFNYHDFPKLKEVLRKHAGQENFAIEGLNSVHIEFLYSKDKKFMAYQVFQYSTFVDVPITDMEIVDGGKAREFIKDLTE